LEGISRVVKSPGVRGEVAFLQAARKRDLPIWSELELASRMTDGDIIAITGTNGKSTTTAWVAHILTQAGIANELAGNIGRPISDAVMTARPGSVFVTEVSSFQLEDIESFRPASATILNLTPDHLDRHGGMAQYREAKMRLFMNQRQNDHAVLGEQEDIVEEVDRRFEMSILRFLQKDRGYDGAFLRDGMIVSRYLGVEENLMPASDLALPGPHNLANALAAICLLLPMGLRHVDMTQSLRTFSGLPHRLERVASLEGVLYVNDSKATNTDSLETALHAFKAPLILLAGGRDKGQDFRPLRDLVRRRCRSVLLFGECEAALREAWGADLCRLNGDLAAALRRARIEAVTGDIVLLSPACASFDQFRDYEDRGNQFRELVQAVMKGCGGSGS
jgi:UDP-N-acetylmuramoylalanine--D-glutamate ligase